MSNKIEILARHDFFKANGLIEGLRPVIKELGEHCKYGGPIDELSRSCTRLARLEEDFKTAVALLQGVADTLASTVKADRRQAEDRGMKILSGLCAKRALEIPAEITKKRRIFACANDRHRMAVDELAKKGFNAAQIRRLTADQPEPDEAAHHAEIAALEQEQAALEAFTGDFPRYDQSLLAGTRFEDWRPEPTGEDVDPAALMRLCRGRGMGRMPNA